MLQIFCVITLYGILEMDKKWKLANKINILLLKMQEQIITYFTMPLAEF